MKNLASYGGLTIKQFVNMREFKLALMKVLCCMGIGGSGALNGDPLVVTAEMISTPGEITASFFADKNVLLICTGSQCYDTTQFSQSGETITTSEIPLYEGQTLTIIYT